MQNLGKVWAILILSCSLALGAGVKASVNTGSNSLYSQVSANRLPVIGLIIPAAIRDEEC